MLDAKFTLMAVGDIGPVYEPADQYAQLVAPILAQADIRMGQCERTYSEKGSKPNFDNGPSGNHSRLHPRMASLWNAAGIDIVSLASNHAMDWGPDAMLDTAELFRGMGKTVIGVGEDGQDARKPAIIERQGARIAILSYCSVLRDGQAAAAGLSVEVTLETLGTLPGRARALVPTHAMIPAIKAAQPTPPKVNS